MTISEFCAWLDGFKEAIGEAPTPEQWAKVVEKLATVSEPPNWGLPSSTPHVPNANGPYWSPSIPTYAPRFGEITCRNLDQPNAPGTRVYVNGQDVGPSD